MTTLFPSRIVPLAGLGALLLLALAIKAVTPPASESPLLPSAPMVAARTLSFMDRADHAVVVSEDGATVAVFEGEQGFLRGILRGLYRTRRGRDVGRDAPFRLVEYADGRLLLDDPVTGVVLDMAAYGPSNEAVFAALMPGNGARKP